jgi:hypothetical protein
MLADSLSKLLEIRIPVPNGVAKLYLKWKIQIFSSIIIMSSPMFQIQTKPSVSKPSRQVLLCRFKNGKMKKMIAPQKS